jgi:hypothetical protein
LTDTVNSTLVLKFNLGWTGIHLALCPRHFIRLARYSWNGTGTCNTLCELEVTPRPTS